MEHCDQLHQNAHRLIFGMNERATDGRFYGSLMRICDLLSLLNTSILAKILTTHSPITLPHFWPRAAVRVGTAQPAGRRQCRGRESRRLPRKAMPRQTRYR